MEEDLPLIWVGSGQQDILSARQTTLHSLLQRESDDQALTSRSEKSSCFSSAVQCTLIPEQTGKYSYTCTNKRFLVCCLLFVVGR